MIRLTEDTEAFAARRRSSQHRLEKALRPVVTRALDLAKDTDGWYEVLATVTQLYKSAYAEESGFYAPPMDRDALDAIHDTLKATDRSDQPAEATVERITVWLATAILSLSTMQAALDDPEELFLEWVDMHDKNVRPAHRDASGQQRPVGEKFDVGGHDMVMPGDSSAPTELWINCRCTLRPVLASEAITAAGFGAPSETTYRDVSSEERKKGAEEGKALPDGSFPIANCQDLRNAIQAIGRAKDPARAKAHIRKRKRALGCPDVDLPDTWALQAAEDPKNTSTVVVALPAEDDPIHEYGDEQKHVTLAFLGDYDGDPQAIHDAVAGVAGSLKPFTAAVSGHGVLGPDKAKVALVEAPEIQQARDRLLDSTEVKAGVEAADSHPHFVPHMTLTYADEPQSADVSEVAFDRLGLWHRDEQTEHPLGAEMTETSWAQKAEAWAQTSVTEAVAIEADRWSGMLEKLADKPVPEAPVEEMPTEPINDEPGAKAPTPEQAVPFHAVLAVEGRKTGDGRRFTSGSLSNRPLPLPFTWQKISAKEHDGNVVVARIEKIKNGVPITAEDGEQLSAQVATGHFIQSAEADEFIGLVGEFGRFGVSIDGDMVVGEVNEDEDCVDFTATRTSSACAVPIPALAEAYISLGEAPEDWPMDEPDEEVKPLVAAAITFKDLAPGRTEDGPGWLTHPVDTDRLRDYWVRGPGAAKIGWGTPGDFNRCRAAVAEYVAPQHLAGYCANRHFDALGFWPGRPVSGDTTPFAYESLDLTDTEPAPMFTLTASGGIKAPAEWFANPNFQMGDERLVEQESGGYAVPFTVTEEGRVFGHIAHWGSCHINPAFAGYCVDPPRSNTNYAYFRTGAVLLDNGEMAATGVISIGGGHAGERLNAKQALAHYDSTSTAACDVCAYDDEFGIAVAGWIRPGISDEMVTAVRASKISGDWRPIGNNPLELVAALAVNVPGFGVSRTRIAAGVEGQISLVAAGMVDAGEETKQTQESIDMEALSYEIALQLDAIQMRRAEMAALAARRGGQV